MKFSRLLIISVLATFFQFNSVSAECIFGPMLGDDISKVEEKYGPADEISDKESIISTMIDDICPGDKLGNSIFEMQYGFRTGRSCEHALLKAQSLLLDSLSKKEISLLLLIDFSKAFDMVEHTILIKKLEHYGIRGIALEWLKSYLGNREQFVTINGKNRPKSR